MTMTMGAPAKTDAALLRLGERLKTAGYRFTTVAPASHERVNAGPGNSRGRSLTDVLGWSRPFVPGALPGDIVQLLEEAGLLRHDDDGWHSLIRVSSYDDELFIHSAFPADEPDAVHFGPDVHRLIDTAVAHLGTARPPARVADLGTGSGAVAIAVAKRVPGAEVVAVDSNRTALHYARINAGTAGTPNVKTCESELLHAVDGTFDLIVSGPPSGAGTDGPLRVLDAAVERLAAGGTLILLGDRDPLVEAAAERFDDTGMRWVYREIDPEDDNVELIATRPVA